VSLASSANSSFVALAKKKRRLEEYEIFQTSEGFLGVGSFGEVRLAQEKPDGDLFAMKIMSKKKLFE
jgi:serine/threonine protein kinase